MKSSFLEELGKFISDNHLFRGSYDRIFISNSFLPQSFRKEIYNIALRYSNSMDLDDSFILMFDKDKKHLCMLFTFFNGKTTILVKDTDDHVQMDGKYTPCMLDDVILDASKTDVRNDLYYSAVDSLKKNYSYSDSEARKEAAIKVDEILQTFNDEDYIDGAKIPETLERIKPIIEEYIVYISELYRTTVEEDKSEVKVLPSIIPLIADVVYRQNKTHRSYEDIQARLATVYSKERFNQIIDFGKRNDLLRSLNPVAGGTCKNDADDEIDYYLYLYKLSNDEYKILFEPLSGKKCTKIFFFKTDKALNISDIKDIAKKYLSMSEEEVIECGYAIRLNHTSEKTYNAVIPYAITMDADKYSCPYGTKDRIDSLNYDESEMDKGVLLS